MLCIDDIEFNQEIFDKAKRKIEIRDYEQICTEVMMCPLCGKDLAHLHPLVEIENKTFNAKCTNCEYKKIYSITIGLIP